MIKIIIAAFIGCLCEYFAFAHILDAPNWLWIIFLHGIASACFTFVSHVFIPAKYKTTVKSGYALLFLLLFTLPVFGILGVVFAITFALSKPLKNDDIDIIEHKVPALPFEARTVSATPIYSIGGLRAILKHASEPNKRLSAVMAARHMSDNQAIPILKLALKDLEDDIRLLAYSTLDSKETKLNEKISDIQHAIEPHNTTAKTKPPATPTGRAVLGIKLLRFSARCVKKYVLEKAENLTLKSMSFSKMPASYIF
ncbi:HEAT repeat domain-containing protein [Pseudoalteromonas espejiana]